MKLQAGLLAVVLAGSLVACGDSGGGSGDADAAAKASVLPALGRLHLDLLGRRHSSTGQHEPPICDVDLSHRAALPGPSGTTGHALEER